MQEERLAGMGEWQEVIQEDYLRADLSARVPADQSMRVYTVPAEHSVPWVLAICWMLSYLLRGWDLFQQAEVLSWSVSGFLFANSIQLSSYLEICLAWKNEENEEVRKGRKERSNECVYVLRIFFLSDCIIFWYFVSHCCPDLWLWRVLSFALCAFRNTILWAKLLSHFIAALWLCIYFIRKVAYLAV